MRRYEVVFVLAPDLPDTDLEETIDVYKVAAEELGAKVLGVEKWVRKQLAFPVKKYTEATYIFLQLEEEQGVAVAELERRFRVTDTVIRFLTIRTDGTDKRIQKVISRQEARRTKSSNSETASGSAELEAAKPLPQKQEEPAPLPAGQSTQSK